MLHDLKIAARTLLRAPSFALAVVLTLALAIGASTAVFSVLRGVLLAPLPFPDPDALVHLGNSYKASPPGWSISPVEYRTNYATVRSFRSVGAWGSAGANLITPTEPIHVSLGLATASLLPTLGIRPALGRWFSPEEETEGADRKLVLGHALWRSRFGSDPGVVGRTVALDGNPYVVVGVLPPDLELPERFDAWAPLALPPAMYAESSRTIHFLRVIGRLAPGVTLEGARRELASASAQVDADHPEAYPAEARFALAAEPLHESMVGDIHDMLWMLFAAVLLVLGMACVNAGNLLVARSTTQKRELAVRAALGASRAGLVRHTLLEALILAVAAGGMGILLAWFGVDLLVGLGPRDLLRQRAAHLDAFVLGFALLATLSSAAFFGVAPAVAAARTDLQSVLRTVSSSAAPRARRLRRALVVTGVALALILLAGASVLLRSFSKVVHVDPGFDPRGAVTLRIALPSPGSAASSIVSPASGTQTSSERARYDLFYQRALQALRDRPGTVAAGAIDFLPMSTTTDRYFDIEGRPTPPGADRLDEQIRMVTPGYFAAIGMRVLRGRPIEETDRSGAPGAVVVNEAFARKYFGGDAIGHRITLDPKAGWSTIVGVVNDVRELGLDTEVTPIMYFPFAQDPRSAMTIVFRSRNGEGAAMKEALSAISGLDPTLPAFAVRPLRELVSSSLEERKFALAVTQAFALIALAFAAIGLYGVLAYTVASRTREIGVRMALGARPLEVLGLVARESAAVVGLGVVLGGAGAAVATRAMGGLLYGVSPLDPVALGVAAGALGIVCIVATIVPARRATRIDPAIALQSE
ncbi:MAG: ABC transporter permease [Myxococcales bacterium]